MTKIGARKALKRRKESHAERAALDPTMLEPDGLREWFLKAVAVLSPDEWAAVRDQVLKGLGETGVKLGACVLLLGIAARDPKELTPPELAMLVRYVRINAPDTLKALSEELMRLERTQHETRAEPTRKAA